MANESAPVKTAKLTPKSDQSGVQIQICAPKWFERASIHSVSNAPAYAAKLSFPGDDLNFAARVLYAEATGSASGISAEDLASEKQAILHVMYFRLNRKGYPSNKYVATTFRMVGEAPQVQFESVASKTNKFTSTEESAVQRLNAANCSDLDACLAAVRTFLANGPDFKTYPYDEFRSAAARPKWDILAKNSFHLTPLGKGYLAELSP